MLRQHYQGGRLQPYSQGGDLVHIIKDTVLIATKTSITT